MSPESCIASLDQALATSGEDVILRRVVGQAPNTVNVDVACRAMVRTYRLKEEPVASAIAEQILIVTISPTEISNARWPGGELANPGAGVADPTLPRRNDQVIVKGKTRTVEAVEPFAVAGGIVRFDMHTVG